MKHKVGELDGALLDAAVAMAEGAVNEGADWFFKDTKTVIRKDLYLPASAWFQAGPIIERERITVGPCRDMEGWYGATVFHQGIGPTPLIAAMRAYVAGKLGEEVELP